MQRKNTPSATTWLRLLLGLLIVLPYAGLYGIWQWYNQRVADIDNARFVIIDKEQMQLHLMDYNGDEVRTYGIACGRNYGNKQRRGDLTTPEGIFRITSIEDASSWEHDFGDGKGKISGAYGPWFLRLAVPGHKGIGIHGTHAPESIGTRATEGCIRLANNDISDLKQRVNPGMVVIVLPSYADLSASQRDSLLQITNRNTKL